MIIYVIHKIGGNQNSPDSLNVTVNYRNHGENRVIARYIPCMREERLTILPWVVTSGREDLSQKVGPFAPEDLANLG